MPRRYLDRRAEMEIEEMLAREELARLEAAMAGEGAAGERDSNSAKPKRGGAVARRAGDWQGLVEQRILEGIERGMFDNLAGMGKPLNLDDDRFVPDEYKMAFRMLRSTGLTPLWIDLNKEIRADLERLEHFRAWVHSRHDVISAVELHHRRKEYEERVQAINSKMLSHNILAPSSQVHFALLVMDEELARFDQPE